MDFRFRHRAGVSSAAATAYEAAFIYTVQLALDASLPLPR